MKKLILILFLQSFQFISHAQKHKASDYYLIKIYHCSNIAQIDEAEVYTGKKLIPFLHSFGVGPVGIFKPINNDTLSDKKLIVWIPLRELETLEKIEQKFASISPFGNDSLVNADSSRQALYYSRIETILTAAFKNQPHFTAKASFTKSADNIYEYRSYESASENLHLRKVHMFNEGGEIKIFERLHFNALFYSRVIVGSRMPNLIYMTRFADKTNRDAHWNQFGKDPEWKRISSLPDYKNSVSKQDIYLLSASVYSEL
jgi:hypothetical protein